MRIFLFGSNRVFSINTSSKSDCRNVISSVETYCNASLLFFDATANASGLISIANVEIRRGISLLHSDKIEIGIIPDPVPTSMKMSGGFVLQIFTASRTRLSVSSLGMRTCSLTWKR